MAAARLVVLSTAWCKTYTEGLDISALQTGVRWVGQLQHSSGGRRRCPERALPHPSRNWSCVHLSCSSLGVLPRPRASSCPSRGAAADQAADLPQGRLPLHSLPCPTAAATMSATSGQPEVTTELPRAALWPQRPVTAAFPKYYLSFKAYGLRSDNPPTHQIVKIERLGSLACWLDGSIA